VLEATGGRRVEYAIEATGVGAVIAALPRLVRRQATVLKYGIGHAGQSMDVMNQMQWKEVTFLVPVGASGGFDADGRPSIYRRALELIQSNTVDVASLVSHRYAGLDAVPDAFSGDHESAEYVKGVAVL
jgi:L-iditol 2-dehydrogenase